MRMIATVRGRVSAVAADQAVVEVSGVGFIVQCSPGILAGLRAGDDAQLATSLVVREDSLTLYGFADADERGLFELLQTASGVGPRLAQAILAVHPPDAVRGAIADGDIPALTQVPGIGRRGAERLVLELRDRIGAVEPAASPSSRRTGGMPWREQVQQALTGLGWSASQASAAVDAVSDSLDGAAPDVSLLLREAIRVLGQSR
jgi:holliday junction DNA helicase RuvA